MLVVLIITTVIYLGLMAVGLRKVFRIDDRLLYLPVLVALGNEGVWHVYPSLLYIFSTARARGLAQDRLAATAIGSALDLTYLFCWLAGFLLIAARARRRLPQGASAGYGETASPIPFSNLDRRHYLRRIRPILYLAVAATVFMYPLSRAFGWPTGYAEDSYYARDMYVGSRLVLLHIIMQKLIQIGPAVGCVCIILRRERPFHRRNLIALAGVFGYALWGFARASRGRVASAFLLLLLATYVMRRKVRYQALLAGAVILFLVVASPVITAVRKASEFREQESMIDRAKLLLSGERTVYATDAGGVERFNNAYITGIVYRETNVRGHVGPRPYYGLPFLLVPRFLWPGKPLFGSVDDTPGGIITFRVYYWLRGTFAVSLTMGPGGQPYWVGGWPAVAGIAFLGGLFVGLLWGYWRVAYHPLGLIALFATMGTGVGFNMIYYDVSWTLQHFIYGGLLVVALYLLTVPFVPRLQGPALWSGSDVREYPSEAPEAT